eukprot:CAMPEP_0178906910 /NCGR_PEP_ID=MMETSP0786-20121207/7077_1 /TAXON_ID=186022 /ORGANISM="Thalassionema frauenfeldii, Strain CCMP 1798" /LENGTH=177 /DNA_ID=CAMNT_0020578649 /DNA_START=194 /DNA_END=727 /DNA_ORIENTATION=+
MRKNASWVIPVSSGGDVEELKKKNPSSRTSFSDFSLDEANQLSDESLEDTGSVGSLEVNFPRYRRPTYVGEEKKSNFLQRIAQRLNRKKLGVEERRASFATKARQLGGRRLIDEDNPPTVDELRALEITLTATKLELAMVQTALEEPKVELKQAEKELEFLREQYRQLMHEFRICSQ